MDDGHGTPVLAKVQSAAGLGQGTRLLQQSRVVPGTKEVPRTHTSTNLTVGLSLIDAGTWGDRNIHFTAMFAPTCQ